MRDLNETYDTKVWEKMFFLWERLDVPEIRTRSFEIGWNTKESPWYSSMRLSQVSFGTKSINLTAKNLLDFREEDDPYLTAAFKILAFIKTFYGSTPLTPVLESIIEDAGVSPDDLWFRSAKSVLPTIEEGEIYEYDSEEEIKKGEWIETTLEAAKYWISIAEEWEIIILPKYTPVRSELNRRFEDFNKRWHNDPEFQQYIKLRLKYGKERQ